MRYIPPILIKFVMMTVIVAVALGIYGVSFGNIIVASILLTGISFLGDLYILPKIGNARTLMADFGLAFVMIWLLGLLLIDQPNGLAAVSFFAAVVILFGEMGYHTYMYEFILKERHMKTSDNGLGRARAMQAEFSSEFEIKREDVEEEK